LRRMPNSSRIPSSTSVQFFKQAIGKHTAVESVSERGSNVFVIDRKVHPSVVVCLTDIYTVGIADVIEAMDEIPGLNCIVTISNWNGYTQAAKEHGVENQVGVFVFAELMGALNRNDLYSYVQRDKDGNPVYHYNG
jgi:hypothetical protein